MANEEKHLGELSLLEFIQNLSITHSSSTDNPSALAVIELNEEKHRRQVFFIS